MKIEIKGTLPELSRLLSIDYYKLHLVDNSEVCIITERVYY